MVRGRDVSLFRPRKRPAAVGEHERWVAVSVSEGTLVAYQGDRPVRALAMSAGAGGANGERFGTPLGGFRVAWKMVTSDMSGNDDGIPWRVAHVPWVAYYQEGYAIHGAWWHDGFGEPRSHGCLNLTPSDARELFGWMDPQLPAGWYAVAADFPWSGGRLGTYIDVGS
jgi:lipoprotein-anchoring transpeptidase ErfK/SrfK